MDWGIWLPAKDSAGGILELEGFAVGLAGGGSDGAEVSGEHGGGGNVRLQLGRVGTVAGALVATKEEELVLDDLPPAVPPY